MNVMNNNCIGVIPSWKRWTNGSIPVVPMAFQLKQLRFQLSSAQAQFDGGLVEGISNGQTK